MKKLLALVVLSGCLATSSFASDVIGHSVKAAGKGSCKAVVVVGKSTAKAVTHIGKHVF